MSQYDLISNGFYGNTTPEELIQKYGSPLYVYNEAVLRDRCKEMRNLVSYSNFKVQYSAKANSNKELLKIIRQEGLHTGAMSPGEIYILMKSGYKPEEILYVANNVSEEEMQYAIDAGTIVSVDSLSQLQMFGRLNPGGNVAIRINAGSGVGHHEKVVTAGKNTKFGVRYDQVEEAKQIAQDHNLQIIGLNQHLGSLFMEPNGYIAGAEAFLSVAEQFENLEFVDFGGGFGIPYRKQSGENRLDLEALGHQLSTILKDWVLKYGKEIAFHIEPGRYVVAESSVILGKVHAVKYNGTTKYVGTDVGFNVLARPVMYDSWHDLEFYRNGSRLQGDQLELATIVGNICESGDIIAKDREVPVIEEGDICGILDAGAYGYSMSSSYNNRLRPAEVIIRTDGSDALIRRRDTLDDLLRNYE
jgi:diaminopimelate decarboxylase